MTTDTATRSWVPMIAWAQVTIGLTGLVGVLASPLAALVVAVITVPIAAACRALVRASRKLDRIMAEELDR
ncbi:hypothetical protein ACQPYE_01425 [Actinosynnema sp. CA-299493]